MTIIKIRDEDSGEIVEYQECTVCEGLGGADHSQDCEVYDDWHECEECDGRGYIDLPA